MSRSRCRIVIELLEFCTRTSIAKKYLGCFSDLVRLDMVNSLQMVTVREIRILSICLATTAHTI